MSLKKRAWKLIVLLGLVSLFADMTYEGARSITGPFLSILGVNGATVGIVVGLGELIGYAFRAVSGYLTDKTHRYWLITFIGYTINLFAVPLLALSSNWQMAAFLIILERFGKAIRVPARDAMLSYASKHTGRGVGFGVHEALDQVGAIVGPLLMAGILLYQKNYRLGFATLVIPAILALILLFITRLSYPRPQDLEVKKLSLQAKGFTRSYWVYLLAVGLVAAGYADFALIAYHFEKISVVSPACIAFFYAIAMGVDGIAALIMGKWFDQRGISILAFITALSALFAPLVFFGGFYFALLGMILWGIGMGAQESIMRASIASLIHPNKRASAYGILNLVFGVFWALGSALIGLFYDVSLMYVVAFSLITQLIGAGLFLSVKLRRA